VQGKLDLAVHIHFALFRGSGGYVLKPSEMLVAGAMRIAGNSKGEDNEEEETPQPLDEDAYWPPARKTLHCATIQVLSLHHLPKRFEKRPNFKGTHSACHSYEPELSGSAVAPNGLDPSSPSITLSVHAVGGFCAVSGSLPLPQQFEEKEIRLSSRSSGGLNAAFSQSVHCVAAEPAATFLRVSVSDRSQEVAFESVVLGRLRGGFRVLQMRSMLGTRIELCYLLLHLEFSKLLNLWFSPRQMRMQNKQARTEAEMEMARLRDELDQFRQGTQEPSQWPTLPPGDTSGAPTASQPRFRRGMSSVEM